MGNPFSVQSSPVAKPRAYFISDRSVAPRYSSNDFISDVRTPRYPFNDFIHDVRANTDRVIDLSSHLGQPLLLWSERKMELFASA